MMSETDIERVRAAASSMASGRPSKRRQMPAIVLRRSLVASNVRSASWDRTMKSSTASVMGSSGRTGQTRSPSTPKGWRDVAIIVIVGASFAMVSARGELDQLKGSADGGVLVTRLTAAHGAYLRA